MQLSKVLLGLTEDMSSLRLHMVHMALEFAADLNSLWDSSCTPELHLKHFQFALFDTSLRQAQTQAVFANDFLHVCFLSSRTLWLPTLLRVLALWKLRAFSAVPEPE